MSSPPVKISTLQRMLYYSIGVSGDVRVTDVQRQLGDDYLVRIITDNQNKGNALSTIIKNKIQVSPTVYLQIVVEDSKESIYAAKIVGSLDDLVEITKDALSGNPLFVASQKARSNALGIVTTRSVIQFWHDDLHDLFSAYNAIAADVFKELLAEQRYEILFGTAQ